jgi:hypothetical protein
MISADMNNGLLRVLLVALPALDPGLSRHPGTHTAPDAGR